MKILIIIFSSFDNMIGCIINVVKKKM